MEKSYSNLKLCNHSVKLTQGDQRRILLQTFLTSHNGARKFKVKKTIIPGSISFSYPSIIICIQSSCTIDSIESIDKEIEAADELLNSLLRILLLLSICSLPPLKIGNCIWSTEPDKWLYPKWIFYESFMLLLFRSFCAFILPTVYNNCSFHLITQVWEQRISRNSFWFDSISFSLSFFFLIRVLFASRFQNDRGVYLLMQFTHKIRYLILVTDINCLVQQQT